jgi:hypothetical protein
VLDGREHGGIIAAVGRHVPEARAVYARVFTAANWGCPPTMWFDYEPSRARLDAVSSVSTTCSASSSSPQSIFWYSH